MKASIEGLELRKTDDPSAINVYLRDHPIGTVVHSGGEPPMAPIVGTSSTRAIRALSMSPTSSRIRMTPPCP